MPSPRALPLVVVSLAVLGCRSNPGLETGAHPSEIEGAIAQLRGSTAAFHDIDAAVAAGYARTVRECLVHEHHGAMGYHHVNRALADATLELERPEILLYEKRSDGSYALNGVEYIVPYRAWSRDSAPPIIMGQKLKREDNLQIWYLHVWAWSHNPDGRFADFHPEVTCPDDARKVFVPHPSSAADPQH
jgi:hypothetical protein